VTILAVYGGGWDLLWGLLWDGNFTGLKICHTRRSPTNYKHICTNNLLQHLLSPQNLKKKVKKRQTQKKKNAEQRVLKGARTFWLLRKNGAISHSCDGAGAAE
jgi:hypothetical protein